MAADLRLMSPRAEKSANEIEMLVLKAARGGELTLGSAQELAAAVPFLDLDAIKSCPCSGPDPVAVFGPVALDLVATGEGPRVVEGDAAVIAALIASYETRTGRRLVYKWIKGGAIFERFEAGSVVHGVRGRRVLPEALEQHLNEMAARTLVPETEASRTGGAGAGLTDND